MIKPKTLQRALHEWPPWLGEIADGRRQRLSTADEGWSYSAKALKKLRLPSKSLFRFYLLSCVDSQYNRNGIFYYDDIHIPEIMQEEYERFLETIGPAIWRFNKVFDFLGIKPIRLCPDLNTIGDFILPPTVWNNADVRVALDWELHHYVSEWVTRDGLVKNPIGFIEEFRKFYSPFFIVLASDHPLLRIGSKMKRKMDDGLASQVAEMKDDCGYKYPELGRKFGWAIQKNEHGQQSKCSTARRYVCRGRKLRDSQDRQK